MHGVMFKKLIMKIIESKDRDEAMEKVYYGIGGVDSMYLHKEIDQEERDMLLALIKKMR